MGRRFKAEDESAVLNRLSYDYYFNRLKEVALSVFTWEGLPDTVDERFLEWVLFHDGFCLFFLDEVVGYQTLQSEIGGELDNYRIPIRRRAYAPNGYQAWRDNKNSVIVFNNLIHTNMVGYVKYFARKLYMCDRSFDVNLKAQRTPIMLQGPESSRLTLENLWLKYDGNQPVILISDKFDLSQIKVLNTNVPYTADKIYNSKLQIWNEAMEFLGVPNANPVKKERLLSDEISFSQGATVTSGLTRLKARQQAAAEINRMFGLNISVRHSDGLEKVLGTEPKEGGSDNE